jgi:hypothetical protein
MKRRGMGIGKGQGYKNMIPKDPYIHSLSARGVTSVMTKKEFNKLVRRGHEVLKKDDKVRLGIHVQGKRGYIISAYAKGKPTDDQLRIMARLHPDFSDMVGKYLNQGMSEKEAVKKVEDLVIKKTREAESKGLLAKGKKVMRLTKEDYDTWQQNMADFKKAKRDMVVKGLDVGFVEEMVGDGDYGFKQFIELQDRLRDKTGDTVEVNDYGQAKIVDKSTKGSVPAYLVVEEDYSVRYYVNPDDRSDTIMKQVFVKYKGER